jgi:hypothetical protein
MTVAAKASMADKPLHIIFTVPIPIGKETLNSKRDKDLDEVLVLVLREWTLVLFMREQWKDAHSAAVRLAKARKIQMRRIRASGDIDEISNALKDNNQKAIYDKAHALRGIALSLQLNEIGKLCNDIEYGIKDKKDINLKELIDNLEQYITYIVKYQNEIIDKFENLER